MEQVFMSREQSIMRMGHINLTLSLENTLLFVDLLIVVNLLKSTCGDIISKKQ